MKRLSDSAQRVFLIFGSIVGWAAIVLQFYLIIANRTASVPETIIRFFSFYTILTNMLVALCFTVLLIRRDSRWGRFFSEAKTITAIAIYISFVGLVYNIILRQIWDPKGLQLVVDELLHTLIPVFFIVYWLVSVPSTGLQWKNVLPWLIYPVCYLIYVLFRGTLSGWYPYPFIDVSTLGYSTVITYCGFLVIGFGLLSLLYVAIVKMKSRRIAG
jgi:hypothetical protein